MNEAAGMIFRVSWRCTSTSRSSFEGVIGMCVGWGHGAVLTSALAADPHVPAAVFDVDPAVHVALCLVMVVNQTAVQVEDEPVSLPAAQDGAWRDAEEVKDTAGPGQR